MKRSALFRMFMILAVLAVIALIMILALRPGVPNTASKVKDFVSRKGAENVSFSDFAKLPHRQREYASSINVEYELKDGNVLLLCGSNYVSPYTISLIYEDGREEILYTR